jgi:hypothetical protein
MVASVIEEPERAYYAKAVWLGSTPEQLALEG